MNNSEYKPDYSLISKYRAVLMGLAIILIMFCHMDIAQEHNGVSATSLAKALHLFTVGVDIFLFLSGVGLYYSYTKGKQPYVKFEKKRLIRILPYYAVIGGDLSPIRHYYEPFFSKKVLLGFAVCDVVQRRVNEILVHLCDGCFLSVIPRIILVYP